MGVTRDVPVDPSDVNQEDVATHDKEECTGCQDAPPAYRAIHEVTVGGANYLRLTTGGTWVIVPDTDAQAGDCVILFHHKTEPAAREIFAVGIVAHVAHPSTNPGIKRGHVILTLKDLRPARATAEATE